MQTDLNPEHRVEAAADFLAVTPRNKTAGSVVAFIMKTWGLSPLQAVDAIRLSNLRKARAH